MQAFQLLRATALAAALVSTAAGAATARDMDRIQGLLDRGQAVEALRELDKLIKQNPNEAETRFTRGIVLVQLNRIGDAIGVFTKLTKDFPKLPEPYNNLAVLYAQQGEYENARGALMSAISTHPSYATAHENLGDIYATMARKAYNRALELDTENQAAKVKLALLDRIVSPPSGEQAVASATPPPKPATRPATNPVPVSIPASKPATVSAKPAAQRPIAVPPPPASKKPAVAVAKPPLTAPAAASRQNQQAAILGTVEAWRKGWDDQDVVAYVAQYSDDFVPPKRRSRAAWEENRAQRLSKPRFIEIKLRNKKVLMLDDTTAQVTFRQSYRSNTYSDQVSKRLTLHKVRGRWLILKEETL